MLRMFEIRHKGLRIVLSKSAMEELLKEGKSLNDVLLILEEGYEPRKRAEDVIEKWIDKGNKTFNAVIVKDYDEIVKEDVWKLIHFGKFTKRKIKNKEVKNEMSQM